MISSATLTDSTTVEQSQYQGLGQQLLSRKIITQDQLNIALKEQKKTSQLLGKTLVSLGFISEACLRDILGSLFSRQTVDLALCLPDPDALQLIQRQTCQQFHIIPVSLDKTNNSLSIAMADIYDLTLIDKISLLSGQQLKIIPLLSSEGDISRAIDRFYGYALSIEGILDEIETGTIESGQFDSPSNDYRQPFVRLLNAILADAVKRGASDIHFEPEEHFLRLRYRIDGVLRPVRNFHRDYWSPLLVRLKVVSNMNIAETRAPQDGRIKIHIYNHPVDFRVSSLPTTDGENMVLRVLDRHKSIVDIHQLGLSDTSLEHLKHIMSRPAGIILVTGPTGSGKTSTLYSMLSWLSSEDINIMTLEDPVEFPLELIRQTSINEVARMDFADGIRSIMRQDPDVILVGEIRDADTASMAFRAAMTGHQVYSTLHSRSAAASIQRLVDMGVSTELMAGNIIGIIGQRLARRLCIHCRQKHIATESEMKLLGLNTDQPVSVYHPTGCDRCQHTGYSGRIAIMEIMPIDARLNQMITQNSSVTEISGYLQSRHFISLADDGRRYILQGKTSLDEICRVIDLTPQV